jgi:glycosyltransferase involved in cell wall biosynthesis
MKVVFINTNDNGGGAAIACRRLHTAIEKYTPVTGTILVQDKNTLENGIETVADTPWKKRFSWLRFVAERLIFLPFERSKKIRFAFNPGVVGIDISHHKLIQEADLIHIHWINFGYLSTDSLQKLFALKKPVVWTFHDMWTFTGGCHHSGECDHYQEECGNCKFIRNSAPSDFSHQRWLAKQKAYQHHPFSAVTCSHWLGNRASQAKLLNGFSINTIPNPIDTDLFRPIPKKEARQKLNLPTDKELILFAAMRVGAAGKGFSFFQEALELLIQRRPNAYDEIELIVFGMAGEKLLEGLPLRTHQLGHISDPEKIVHAYCAGSMFVTPSLEENLPNTIMEAFACGTPAVGFTIGGIPEMIGHQHNGYLANYRSAKSIADGIEWIIENNQDGSVSINARNKALSDYQEAVVAKQYYELYQSLI